MGERSLKVNLISWLPMEEELDFGKIDSEGTYL